MANDGFRSIIIVLDLIEINFICLEPRAGLFSDGGKSERGG